MNIFKTIKILWKLKSMFSQLKEAFMEAKKKKSGFLSSAFTITAVNILATLYFTFKEQIPAKWSLLIGGVVGGIYCATNAWVKHTEKKTDDELLAKYVEAVNSAKIRK